jgi:hypothetical protein
MRSSHERLILKDEEEYKDWPDNYALGTDPYIHKPKIIENPS